MEQDPVDFYETLQISPNADPDTIQRVYRLLAQRFHPDNQETGNAERFRLVSDAYSVLSDPQKRAQYDVAYQAQRQNRWRLVNAGTNAENDFEIEQAIRLTTLEVLYTQRRTDSRNPEVFPLDLEEMLGAPREQIEFCVWYLIQKKFVQRSDASKIMITAEGVDYLENNYKSRRRRRLSASTESE